MAAGIPRSGREEGRKPCEAQKPARGIEPRLAFGRGQAARGGRSGSPPPKTQVPAGAPFGAASSESDKEAAEMTRRLERAGIFAPLRLKGTAFDGLSAAEAGAAAGL